MLPTLLTNRTLRQTTWIIAVPACLWLAVTFQGSGLVLDWLIISAIGIWELSVFRAGHPEPSRKCRGDVRRSDPSANLNPLHSDQRDKKTTGLGVVGGDPNGSRRVRSSCDGCKLLWDAHNDLTSKLTEVKARIQAAETTGDQQGTIRLRPLLHEIEDARLHLQKAIQSHNDLVHPGAKRKSV